MKKKLLVLFATVICLTTNYTLAGEKVSTVNTNSKHNQDFIYNFENCNQYISDDGYKITAILGWSNRKCYITEITHRQTLTCAFKLLELQDVIRLMKENNYLVENQKLQTIQSYEMMPFTSSYCSFELRNLNL